MRGWTRPPRRHRDIESLFHPEVIFRSVVKADDGLCADGNADENGNEDLVDLHDDAVAVRGISEP